MMSCPGFGMPNPYVFENIGRIVGAQHAATEGSAPLLDSFTASQRTGSAPPRLAVGHVGAQKTFVHLQAQPRLVRHS